jgi:hypothetical protein
MKVTMKVDPAACKNGEITHFKEYVGFVLAEKEFEKTYEKLLKQYTIQNEGFFDAVGGALRAVGRRLKDDIVSPFKDAKYNPFVGHGDKPVDTTESGQIINEIESEWLDVNKKIEFYTKEYGTHTKSFKDLADKDPELNNWLNSIRKAVKENYTYSDLADTLLEKINITTNPRSRTNVTQRAPQQNVQQTPQLTAGRPQPRQPQPRPAQKTNRPSQNSRVAAKSKQKSKQQTQQPPEKTDYVSVIKGGINQTDLNRQIPVRNMQNVYLPMIEKKIKEENDKRKEMREDVLKVKSQDVWKTLVQKVETLFRASKNYSSDEKITWAFMLAQPNQKIALTYDPINQPNASPTT